MMTTALLGLIFAWLMLMQAQPPSKTPNEPAPVAPAAYLATYFLANGEDGVYLASSTDGLTFEPLLEPNIPILAPRVGREKLTRDACLLLGPDRCWHMCWTTGWWERGFGLAHSADLIEWSEQAYIEPMKDEPEAINCWAPEICWDPAGAEYVFLWSTTVKGRFPQTEAAGDSGPGGVKLNHRIYSTATADFASFAPASLYYDPGFNCIDASLLPPARAGEPWWLFLKDETRYPPSKNIRVLKLTDPRSAKGAPSSPITGNFWAEGPSAVRSGDITRVFFDRYSEDRFGAVETTDFESWRDISDKVRFPAGARHTTVVAVTPAFVEQTRAKLKARGAPLPRP